MCEDPPQALPFLEYELHRQLMLKLRVAGMNAVFSLKSQLQIGTSLMVSLAQWPLMIHELRIISGEGQLPPGGLIISC
jgi:hypothetical protein